MEYDLAKFQQARFNGSKVMEPPLPCF